MLLLHLPPIWKGLLFPTNLNRSKKIKQQQQLVRALFSENRTVKRKASARSAVISSDKSNERESEKEKGQSKSVFGCVCVCLFVGGSA